MAMRSDKEAISAALEEILNVVTQGHPQLNPSGAIQVSRDAKRNISVSFRVTTYFPNQELREVATR